MRKALFLTRNFPPYVMSGASRAWKFASNLTSIGWEPVVIAPPSIKGMDGRVKSGINPVPTILRTADDIDAGAFDALSRNELLHGLDAPVSPSSLTARLTGLFRSSSDGDAWEKNAAAIVERLLAEQPEIDLLYAQGPPLEPLRLALATARRHTLAVILDITAPLDPSMPRSGASGTSAAAEAEAQLLLSGVPLLTPTRNLKEYFLKKYHGRLDHNLVTIVAPAFDASHAAFRQQSEAQSDTSLRIALQVDELPRAELKALITGLDGWLRTDGIAAGGVEIMLLGAGAPALLNRVARKPLEKLLTIDPVGGIDSELGQCRKAAAFCAVMGGTQAGAGIIADRLVDALGMGLPLYAIAPEGAASRLVLDAGGMISPSGNADAIMELFRTMASAWSFRSRQSSPGHLRQKHDISLVMKDLTRAIAGQPVQ